MTAYGIRGTGTILTSTPVPEVQTITLTSWDATDTVKLTYNGHETSAITYNATPATNAAAFQAALEALVDFDAGDVVVAATNINVYTVTFGGAFAGVNAGAITVTSGTGSAAGTVAETTSGRSSITKAVPLGSRFGILHALRWGLFVDGASNELVITDAAGRVVYSVTGKDTNVSGVKLATQIGQDGRDQGYNAAANLLPTFVEGPLSVRVRNGSGTVSPASGEVEMLIQHGFASKQLAERSTGTIAVNASGDKTVSLSMGSTVGRVLHVRVEGFDSSTDYSVKDAWGQSVFVKTGLDATTALDFPLGFDGEDQAGNAAADALPGVFRGPLTVIIANGGASTTGKVTLWCEI